MARGKKRISTYNRLLKLYRKNKNYEKTPLEDYTTEILVGLLEDNQNILSDFVNNLMGIPGESFKIESQKKYHLKDDIDCIVDIVIENEDMICFLENKVNSTEGERQLERYTKVLNEISIKKNKRVYLRYCTKYYDKKIIMDINFIQIRWMNVYKFLKAYEINEIVKEFLIFLRSEGMATAGDFNFQDLIVLSNINSTMSKIYEYFDNIKGNFEDKFGKSKQSNNNGFWLYKDNVFGEGYSEIYFGFSLSENNDIVIPYLMCGIYSKRNNTRHDKFSEYIKKDNIFDYVDIQDVRVDGYFKEPLSNVIVSNNQSEEIEGWFIDKLDKISKLKEQVKELGWNN